MGQASMMVICVEEAYRRADLAASDKSRVPNFYSNLHALAPATLDS
jgi:hypothetical protein